MGKYVRDRTGRFSQRPHYEPEELDRTCESLINTFLEGSYGTARFPVSTDDLTRLVERDTEYLDLYADLSGYGADMEGLTQFRLGDKPAVRISAALAEDERRENRRRTTLTHEIRPRPLLRLFQHYYLDVDAMTRPMQAREHPPGPGGGK